MPLPGFVALLRGINVGGRNPIPMGPLRAACEALGWREVRTYIQSGNVVFRADAAGPALERELEGMVEERFGLCVPVIVRAGSEWPRYVGGNPFRAACETEPNLVMLALSKAPPHPDAAAALQARAAGGERVVAVGDVLWIHFAGGAGRSKLTPALLDRLVGSAVTTRNWRTVLRLGELVEAAA